MKGRVIKSTGSWYKVQNQDLEVFDCRVRGKFRTKGIKTTNPLSVGDWVEFDFDSEHNAGIIHKLYERENYVIRKSVNLSKQAHIIAANLDQSLLIVTLVEPPTSHGFIDRFLVSSEAYGVPVILVFNKTDLYDESALDELEFRMLMYLSLIHI